MKILADQDIPLVEYFFSDCAEIIYKKGREISNKDLIDVDMLLVRSVTLVNQTLLEKTNVRFIGSVTTGADHLDTTWLQKAGIEWHLAKGCNAKAVVEYIISVIALLQKKNLLTKKSPRAAVIGVGEIGSEVVTLLKFLGFEVFLCDPIRAELDSNFQHTPLQQLKNLDFISLHVPLTTVGNFPTYQFLDKHFFKNQAEQCVLVNTSRGEVIQLDDLKQCGQHLIWCFDVWKDEPHVDKEILQKTFISTPHIAGYSVQSKKRGIEMIYQAALHSNKILNAMKSVNYDKKILQLEKSDLNWRDIVLKIFNPLEMSLHMKQSVLENSDNFDRLRKQFNSRYEFHFIQLDNSEYLQHQQKILTRLGFSFV